MEGKFPREPFSEKEYGAIGTRKPYVLTAVIFLFFFSYCGLKNSEGFRKTGSLLSLYTNGYQNRLLAHLCWRTVRPNSRKNCSRCAVTLPEAAAAGGPLGAVFVESWHLQTLLQVINDHFCTPRSISQKENTLRRWSGLSLLLVSSPCVTVLLLPPGAEQSSLGLGSSREPCMEA